MKKLALLLAFGFLLGIAAAETVFERSFQEMGFESFIAEGASVSKCVQWSFLYPSDVNVQEPGLYPIFSLNAKLSPIISDTAKFSVKLNSQLLEEPKADELYCREMCWKRILLDKGILSSEENTLEICAKTSNTTTRIEVLNDSVFGAYKMPVFENFEKHVSRKHLEVGEEITITVSITNKGSEAGEITLKRMKPLVEELKDIKIFDVIRGEGEWSGAIEAGKTKEIEYAIRPNIVSRITLPAASAYYKNVFGEEQKLHSNYPTIWVEEPKTKLDIAFVKEGKIFSVGSFVPLKMLVKNNSISAVSMTELVLTPSKHIKLGKSKFYITVLDSGESKEFETTAQGTSAGSHEIGCKINYADGNSSACNGTTLAFEEQEIDPMVWVALFFVAIGVGIYLYIQFKG